MHFNILASVVAMILTPLERCLDPFGTWVHTIEPLTCHGSLLDDIRIPLLSGMDPFWKKPVSA